MLFGTLDHIHSRYLFFYNNNFDQFNLKSNKMLTLLRHYNTLKIIMSSQQPMVFFSLSSRNNCSITNSITFQYENHIKEKKVRDVKMNYYLHLLILDV